MRVGICDDAPMWREALSDMLERAGVTVCVQAASAGEMLSRLAVGQPDVVILDLQLAQKAPDGLALAEQIRVRWPRVGILILSAHLDAMHIVQLFKDGESGLGALSKDRVDDVEMLIEALERVAGGGTVADQAVVMDAFRQKTRRASAVEELTPRQREVLMLLAEGRSNYGIAQQLNIAEKTVEGTTRALFLKLGLADDRLGNRRVLAALEWLRASSVPRERRLSIAPRQ